MKQRVFRKSRSGNPSHTTITRIYRFDTLEIGDSIDILSADKWRSARESARQYGQRSGKKFVAGMRRARWVDGYGVSVDHKTLRVERTE